MQILLVIFSLLFWVAIIWAGVTMYRKYIRKEDAAFQKNTTTSKPDVAAPGYFRNKYWVIIFGAFSILFSANFKTLETDTWASITFDIKVKLLGMYTGIIAVESLILGSIVFGVWYLVKGRFVASKASRA